MAIGCSDQRLGLPKRLEPMPLGLTSPYEVIPLRQHPAPRSPRCWRDGRCVDAPGRSTRWSRVLPSSSTARLLMGRLSSRASRPVPVGDCLPTLTERPGPPQHRPPKAHPGCSSLRHRAAVSHSRSEPEGLMVLAGRVLIQIWGRPRNPAFRFYSSCSSIAGAVTEYTRRGSVRPLR
jgi:hypothetical protein